ncbi:MAG: heavy-metal-associated domain-containing protein [Myxococcales bacterium]|nr:heavy-metal-associated domain-containing protein [Myxococcales bacterium]
MTTTIHEVHGMTCGGCVNTLTKALERAFPEAKVKVTLEGGRAELEGPHEPAKVAEVVEGAGFDYAGPLEA